MARNYNGCMSARVREHATYEDLLQVPEHMVAELIDGELYASPRPAPRHANAASSLGYTLGPPFHHGRGGPGGWHILFEPELHFGRNVLVPDLAGWRRERMPELPETAYFALPPDWICEVSSPSSGRLARLKKLPIYGREGVAYAWLIEPEQQMLEVFRNEDGAWKLAGSFGEEAIVRVAPFDAVELDLTLIWGPAPA